MYAIFEVKTISGEIFRVEAMTDYEASHQVALETDELIVDVTFLYWI